MLIYAKAGLSALLLGLAAPAMSAGSSAPAPHTIQAPAPHARVLSDSEIQRLNYYAAQALSAMVAYGNAADSSTVLDTLRQKILRLTDAGQRSGMTLTQTADYFQAYVFDGNTGAVPPALRDSSGRFDARTLLSSVQLYTQNKTPENIDVASVDKGDLAALKSVAQPLTPQKSSPTTLQLSVVAQPAQAAETTAGPVISPNTPANVRAILERVQVRGSDWVITVAPGDSLSQYANALYGDMRQTQKIYQANQAALSSSEVITVGQDLVLPKN